MRIFNKIFITIILLLTFFSCIDEHVIEVNENLNGSIYLTSQPSGSKIFLLGTDTKKTTPDSLINLESGLYEVSLKLDNYKDTSFAVQVFKNRRTTKNIKLKPESSYGKIIINSVPANAEIFLNNKSTHKFTPDSLTNIAVGNYIIKLVLENYLDTSFAVTVTENNARIIKTVKLKSSTPSGEIFIDSSPSGAEIFFNGDTTGFYTPDTIKNLFAGEYVIKLTHKNYSDTTFTVILNDSEKLSKFIELKPLPPNGNIFITSDPIGANIFLQGNYTGKQTPDTLKQVLVGNYLLTLKLQDFKDTSFIATVTENNTTDYKIVLVDTTSDVTVNIIYNVNSTTGQLKFYFTFNQDIALDYIDLREPNSTDIKTYPYSSQHYAEGVAAEIVYPEKISGLWRFSISGKKLGGRKTEFKINKAKSVQ